MANSASLIDETPVAFIDLAEQLRRIRPAIDKALTRVLDHGQFIMGPEVAEFEGKLAAFCGAKHAISCSSGTDALLIYLMSMGIGPGDGVVCPAFTYTATPEVIALLGATPIWVDVESDSYNVDVEKLSGAFKTAEQAGVKLRGIVAVDLFGRPADYARIEAFAGKHGLWVLCDAAQSFGASIGVRRVGTFGSATATSFFPAKPLGCFGDGGAILVDDDKLADTMRSIRLHGKGDDKYDIVRVGINGRLDTIQAAVLIEKLKIFQDEIDQRNRVARAYENLLAGAVRTPGIPEGVTSVWAQYTVHIPAARRDAVMKTLKSKGIPTAVYYPRPLHHQTAYTNYPIPVTGLPVAEELCQEVMSLPMHPYMTEKDVERIAFALRQAVNES